LNEHRFVIARPWRHGDRHRGQRHAAEAPELKVRAQWNRHRFRSLLKLRKKFRLREIQ
jgi:hypothetical protein